MFFILTTNINGEMTIKIICICIEQAKYKKKGINDGRKNYIKKD